MSRSSRQASFIAILLTGFWLVMGTAQALEKDAEARQTPHAHKHQGEHKQCMDEACEGRHKQCGHHKGSKGHGHGYHKGSGHGMGMMDGQRPDMDTSKYMDKLAAELNLDGQQQQDLKAIGADYGERFKDLAQQTRKSAEKLRDTEPGDADYWPLTQAMSTQAASAAGETVILLGEMREKVYSVLTPEQQEQFQAKYKAWRENHGKQGHHGKNKDQHHGNKHPGKNTESKIEKESLTD